MRKTVPHTLSPSAARELIRRALETYRQHYPEHAITGDWIDADTAVVGFHVTGRRVDGRLKVCPECFDIHVDLPWMMRPFQGRIASALEAELQRWLAHAARRAS